MSSEENGPDEGEDQQGLGGQEQNGGQGQPQGGQQGGQPQGGQAQGGQSQGGQQGGQPTSGQGQGGQPQGGQPQAGQGQPQGGQPQAAGGGQPQSGYQQGGAQPVPQESIGDIFSKPNTVDEMKTLLLLYAAMGVGVGIAVAIYINQASQAVGGGSLVVPLIAGPLIAAGFGLHSAESLADESDELVYATVSVGCYAGNLVMGILGTLLAIIAIGQGAGDVFSTALVISLIGGIGAAIAAVGGVYAANNFNGERQYQTPQGTPQQAQQPGRQQ
ncbi:MAG: hypothetical protein ABEJ85_00480 [Haloarculaceae archaeon]